MPEQVLSSLLSKVEIKEGSVLGLVNLSPYDGWLETTAYQWMKQTGVRMPCLSLSKSVTIIDYCQRALALKLLEDK